MKFNILYCVYKLLLFKPLKYIWKKLLQVKCIIINYIKHIENPYQIFLSCVSIITKTWNAWNIFAGMLSSL